jgi:hypothetical protein
VGGAGNGIDAAGNGTDGAGNGIDAAGNGTDGAGNGTDAAGNGTDAAGNGTDAAGNGTAVGNDAAGNDDADTAASVSVEGRFPHCRSTMSTIMVPMYDIPNNNALFGSISGLRNR